MRGPNLMRLALALTIGCLAVAHGSSEMESPYELGDSNDYGAGLKEKEFELQAAQDDPSVTSFHIDAESQEDRIGGSVEGFDDDASPAKHAKKPASAGDSMQDELRAIRGDDSDGDPTHPALIGEAEEPADEEPADDEPSDAEEIESAADSQEGNTKSNEEKIRRAIRLLRSRRNPTKRKRRRMQLARSERRTLRKRQKRLRQRRPLAKRKLHRRRKQRRMRYRRKRQKRRKRMSRRLTSWSTRSRRPKTVLKRMLRRSLSASRGKRRKRNLAKRIGLGRRSSRRISRRS